MHCRLEGEIFLCLCAVCSMIGIGHCLRIRTVSYAAYGNRLQTVSVCAASPVSGLSGRQGCFINLCARFYCLQGNRTGYGIAAVITVYDLIGRRTTVMERSSPTFVLYAVSVVVFCTGSVTATFASSSSVASVFLASPTL